MVRISFTKELKEILKKLEGENNYLAYEILWLSEKDSNYHNGLKISKVDISKNDYCFDVTIDGVVHPMKIGQFAKFYFKDLITDGDLREFSKRYNILKGSSTQSIGNKIVVPEFVYNPKDPRSTFLSMVTKTYPHGHDEEVLKFLPKLEKDIVGNYYLIIGDNPTTMFTSHLDTADREQSDVNLSSIEENGEEYIVTDETTILGADDKAGITVMLYMISHGIKGLYYFFIGEERGGIGSHKLADVYDSVDYLKSINKCVSFDRRNYHSVITQQMGKQCCSNEFATNLCREFTKGGLELSLDPTGIYTDSASFIDIIPECTNISVGYFNEHTGREYQNMTFLDKLCKASILVNWDSLTTSRKLGPNKELITKWRGLINDIKKSIFSYDCELESTEWGTFVKIDLEDMDIDSTHEGLLSLSQIFLRHKVNPDILFDGSYIKIELK